MCSCKELKKELNEIGQYVPWPICSSGKSESDVTNNRRVCLSYLCC